MLLYFHKIMSQLLILYMNYKLVYLCISIFIICCLNHSLASMYVYYNNEIHQHDTYQMCISIPCPKTTPRHIKASNHTVLCITHLDNKVIHYPKKKKRRKIGSVERSRSEGSCEEYHNRPVWVCYRWSPVYGLEDIWFLRRGS